MLRTATTYDGGPIALRYPRGEAVGVQLPADPEPIAIGTGEILREGSRVALIGYGTGVEKALEAADILGDVTVADARFAKPIDIELMASLAESHELLVTVEEGVLQGGFGSAVWEELNNASPPTLGTTPILRVGLPDRYVTHGKPALLHREVGFTGKAIAERVRAAVGSGTLAEA
jgi:1-deoxy-D-xylulose-5-phosphate synthase